MGCEFECGGCQDLADDIIHDALANPQDIDQQAA
jgi:bacterioferritin-associated ferredoxin